jgi:hypothetical protein
LSPACIARGLASIGGLLPFSDDRPLLSRTNAYFLENGKPVAIPSHAWHRYASALDERKKSFPRLDPEYRDEIKMLPPGVFVWKLDFEFDYGGRVLHAPGEPENPMVRVAWYEPLIPADMRKTIMEGFERYIAPPKQLSDESARHWLNQPRWEKEDALFLLQAIDPRDPIPIDSKGAIVEEANRIYCSFFVGKRTPEWPRSPADWIERAKEAGIPIPKSLKLSPDWENWMLLESAYPWQLASLSLNIEPSKIEQDGPRACPDNTTLERFESVTEAIKQRFKAGSYEHVNIAEFVAWADSKNIEIPAGLRAMASDRVIAPENGEPPPTIAHEPGECTHDDRDTIAPPGDVADSCLARREKRLKKWLKSKGIPESQWCNLAGQERGYSMRSIYNELKEYPEFKSAAGQGSAISESTFNRKFWKEQNIAKILDGG